MQQSEKGSVEGILAEMRGLALRAVIRQAMEPADAVNDGDG